MSQQKDAFNWLSRHRVFDSILPNATRNLSLEKVLSELLPSHLLDSVSVIGLQEEKLTLAVRNAAVASRIKHLSPSIIETLTRLGWKVSAIRTKTQSFFSVARQEKRKIATISEKEVNLFESLADALADSPLKSAVQNLVRNHSQK